MPGRRPQKGGDFNPRPLAGATGWLWLLDHFCRISIHAPLRGRRVILLGWPGPRCISIHAPLRGRLFNGWSKDFISYFNPRPLAGATG